MLRINYKSELTQTKSIINAIQELKKMIGIVPGEDTLHIIRTLECQLVKLELEQQISIDEIDLFVDKCIKEIVDTFTDITYKEVEYNIYCVNNPVLCLDYYNKEDIKTALKELSQEEKEQFYNSVFDNLGNEILRYDYFGDFDFDYNTLFDFKKYIMFLLEGSTISLEFYKKYEIQAA